MADWADEKAHHVYITLLGSDWDEDGEKILNTIAAALRAERARVRPAIEAALLYMDLYGPGDSSIDQMLRAAAGIE